MPNHDQNPQEVHYSLRKEINELYWVIAIRNFATGMAGLFVPIYVYLYFEQSLIPVLFFYAIQYLGMAVFVPLGAKLLGKIGVKKAMAVGNPFLAGYIVSLILAGTYGDVFIGLALVSKIIYLATFWPARHVDFARFAQSRKRGRQVSFSRIIISLTKTVAPFISGLILVSFGFNTMLGIAAALIAVSSAPLFLSQEVYEKYSFSWLQSYKKLWNKKHRRNIATFFFEGIETSTSLVLFPIFIFAIIPELDTLGSLTSISLLFTVLFSYIVGWVSDKRGARKVLKFSSFFYGLSWIGVMFIGTPMQYLVASSFQQTARASTAVAYSTYFYKLAKSKRRGIDEFIVMREIVINSARVLTYATVALLVWLGMDNVMYFFPVAALAGMGLRRLK